MLVYQDGHVERTDRYKPNENEVGFVHLLKPTNEEIRAVIGEMFGCHPLVVEDCVAFGQRPKVDIYEDHAFIPFFVTTKDGDPEELAMVIGANYLIVITTQEYPFMSNLISDFQRSPGKMRRPGLILYHILDHCVDQYFDVVDDIEDTVTNLENAICENPFHTASPQIFSMKRWLHKIRRIFSEERDVLGTLMHSQFPYTQDEINVYLLDVFDHLNRVVDAVDNFRESMTGLLELQMSLKSDRMNAIMKTLTIVSTFFLPLTFIVGLYGMNFKVPEYGWKYGYGYVWGVMIVITIGMWLYFKRKNWW